MVKSKLEILNVISASKIYNHPLSYSKPKLNGVCLGFQIKPNKHSRSIIHEEILEIKKSFETEGVKFKKIEKRKTAPQVIQYFLSSVSETLNVILEFDGGLHEVSIGIMPEYRNLLSPVQRVQTVQFSELDDSIITKLLESRYRVKFQ